MRNFAKSWLPSGFIIKGTDANMVYKLAVEKGFFFYLSDSNLFHLFSYRDLDGNELKKLPQGSFSNLVSLQEL